MQPKSHSIVILGAGYAGLLCAIRLSGRLHHEIRRGTVQITLINGSADFVQRIRLHEIAAGLQPRRKPIERLLRGTGVRLVQGWVKSIEPSDRAVMVDTADHNLCLPYTALVYALGSVSDTETVPGAAQYSYTLDPTGERGVKALKDALTALAQRGGNLTVVGGGATGIEAAAEFAGRFPALKVRLATRGMFGEFTTPRVQSLLRRELERQNVEILEDTHVTRIEPGLAETSDGQQFGHDLIVWTGGFRAPEIAKSAGLAVNWQGRAWVDAFLRAVGHPEIFVIGDAGIPREIPGAPYRMSAVVATVSGAYVADQIAKLVHERPIQPFHFGFLGQGIATGPGRGVGFGKTFDDVPSGPYFTGRLGWMIRAVGVRYLHNLFKFERWWTGSFIFWVNRRAPQVGPAASKSTHGV